MQRGMHGSGLWVGVVPPMFSLYTSSMPLDEMFAELVFAGLPEPKKKRALFWLTGLGLGLLAIWHLWAAWCFVAWAVALLIYEIRQWPQS